MTWWVVVAMLGTVALVFALLLLAVVVDVFRWLRFQWRKWRVGQELEQLEHHEAPLW